MSMIIYVDEIMCSQKRERERESNSNGMIFSSERTEMINYFQNVTFLVSLASCIDNKDRNQ